MNLKKQEKPFAETTDSVNELANSAEHAIGEMEITGQKKPKKKGKPITMKTLKKYFNQKTFLGIALASLMVFVLVYVFVYLDYAQRTEELQLSNQTLKQTVKELQIYYENMDTYNTEIKEMQTSIEEIMTEYPVDVREEDLIMLAVQIQNQNTIAYDAVNMSETEEVYAVPAESVQLAGIDGFEALTFKKRMTTYVNQTNYENLKNIIAQIFASDNRIGINNIVYSKDTELGVLTGNIDLYFYSAAGTGKEYVAPDITEYTAGTSDIFQSSKVKLVVVDDTTAEGDGAEDDGE